MRITQEVDYAFRIMAHLARKENEVIGAPIIAEKEAIPVRFTLRILRKLNLAGLTHAKRGASGGYMLKKKKEDINLYDIILAVDGPIIINRCLFENDPFCSRNNHSPRNGCKFHNRLGVIQKEIIDMFTESNLTDFI